ncbi:hypothetical protein SLS60_003516 [Paraconiothyrium brasiliense]|uniref:Uncharacterized protein n=1 Tax=Paraconiothyrium brasiliense TaxID=300254 RepID=A0ABR3RW62_9PLEO
MRDRANAVPARQPLSEISISRSVISRNPKAAMTPNYKHDGPVLISPQVEDWEVIVEEIPSDDDLDSEIWSDASSKEPHVTPKHYDILPMADIKDSFEEAMLKTLKLKDFDAVMADMMGETALDDGTHDPKLIRQLREGIDESNKKLGLPTLGEVYGPKSKDGKVEVGMLAEAMKKSPATLKAEKRWPKVEQRGNKRPERPGKQTGKNPAQTEIFLKKPVNEGKAPKKPHRNVKSSYLEQSRKHQASVSKDHKEGEGSTVLAWWEKS